MNNTTLHPDTVCKGIAKLSDIKPGVVLWHVYGHLPMSEPTKIKILQVPQTYRNHRVAEGRPMGEDCYDIGGHWYFSRVMFDDGDNYDRWSSLGDCGIGANHNTNRLLLTREAALKYHKAAKAWNDANPKFMGRHYDPYDDFYWED